MANLNSANGFHPCRHGAGGTIRVGRAQIAGGLASNIYRDTLVIPVTGGPNIDVATAGVRVLGTFDGCNYVDANGDTQFRPRWLSGQTVIANSIVEASIYDDPNILFDVQVSGAAGLVSANIGKSADAVISGGNAQTGNSTDQLDQTTIDTTQRVFKILELLRTTNNNFGQFARAVVQVMKHYRSSNAVAGASAQQI